MLVSQFPASELWLTLRQHQQTAFLTPHPEVILIIFKQGPYGRGTQVERCTLILITLHTVFPLGYPTETIAHCSDKQVAVAVEHSGSQQDIFAREFSKIKIVVIHLSIAIIEYAMDGNHQHSALITYKAGNGAIWRHKLLKFPIRGAMNDCTAMS